MKEGKAFVCDRVSSCVTCEILNYGRSKGQGASTGSFLSPSYEVHNVFRRQNIVVLVLYYRVAVD